MPTAAHWEAYWIPRSGLPLARGWYRQLEIADYPTLFHGKLTPAVYRAWLGEMGVKYVLLPATKLDPVDSHAEARLLRSGAAGLEPVFKSRTGTIYAVTHPSPLLTGPGPSQITALGHEDVSGWVGRAGRYTVARSLQQLLAAPANRRVHPTDIHRDDHASASPGPAHGRSASLAIRPRPSTRSPSPRPSARHLARRASCSCVPACASFRCAGPWGSAPDSGDRFRVRRFAEPWQTPGIFDGSQQAVVAGLAARAGAGFDQGPECERRNAASASGRG